MLFLPPCSCIRSTEILIQRKFKSAPRLGRSGKLSANSPISIFLLQSVIILAIQHQEIIFICIILAMMNLMQIIVI